MRVLLQLTSFAALVLSAVWLWFHPGFESGTAAAASLVALIASFVYDKKAQVRAAQSQRVSGGSTAVQAGRDASVGKLEK